MRYCFNGFFTGKMLESIAGVGSQEAGLELILFDVKNKQSKKLYSKISYPYPRNYSEGKTSLTLILSNKLTNILNFVDNIRFYYSNKKKQESNVIRKLILKKLKNMKLKAQKGVMPAAHV